MTDTNKYLQNLEFTFIVILEKPYKTTYCYVNKTILESAVSTKKKVSRLNIMEFIRMVPEEPIFSKCITFYLLSPHSPPVVDVWQA